MSLGDEFREMYVNDRTSTGPVRRALVLGKHWWQTRQRTRQMPRLGQLLLSQGLVQPHQLEDALRTQQASGKRLGEVLLAAGVISRTELAGALRRQDKVSAAFTALMLSLAHTTAADAEGVSTELGRHEAMAVVDDETRAVSAPPAMRNDATPRRSDASRAVAAEAAAEARALFGQKNRQAAAADVVVERDADRVSGDLFELVDRLAIHSRFKTRVRDVLPAVRRASAEFDVPVERILAIIHTESSFRDNATTNWKAVGLMQVVAKSGGAEAIRLIKGRRGFPSHSALLKPAINIRIGTAYLRSLEDRHFAFITNDDVREAAVIAAYNQGPTKIRNILRKHGVPRDRAGFRALLARYSVPQTSDYLVKVTRREALYRPLADNLIASAR
jgi:soluble lytic murein transglycosylase-like protein